VIEARTPADVAAAVEDAGPDGDVFVLNESVDLLEQLRGAVAAPNVSYFVAQADVLPLPDHSVDSVVTYVAWTTEAEAESARVLRAEPGAP
jgi:ubiquinone/menaquinone biosynthesis C-methylase UbiE